MENNNVGKDLINSALSKSPVSTEDTLEALKSSEFCNVVQDLISAHETSNDMEHGECHIAIDKLPKSMLPKGIDNDDGGVSIAVCGSINSMDKFHIIDALMDALDMDERERVTFFAANARELLDR